MTRPFGKAKPPVETKAKEGHKAMLQKPPKTQAVPRSAAPFQSGTHSKKA